jgi:hypothetical protein
MNPQFNSVAGIQKALESLVKEIQRQLPTDQVNREHDKPAQNPREGEHQGKQSETTRAQQQKYHNNISTVHPTKASGEKDPVHPRHNESQLGNSRNKGKGNNNNKNSNNKNTDRKVGTDKSSSRDRGNGHSRRESLNTRDSNGHGGQGRRQADTSGGMRMHPHYYPPTPYSYPVPSAHGNYFQQPTMNMYGQQPFVNELSYASVLQGGSHAHDFHPNASGGTHFVSMTGPQPTHHTHRTGNSKDFDNRRRS